MSEHTGSGRLAIHGRAGWWHQWAWWPTVTWLDTMWYHPYNATARYVQYSPNLGGWWLNVDRVVTVTIPVSGGVVALSGEATGVVTNEVVGDGSLVFDGTAPRADVAVMVGSGGMGLRGSAEASATGFTYGWFPSDGWWPGIMGWWFSSEGNYEQQWSL